MDNLVARAVELSRKPTISLPLTIKNRIAYVLSHGASYASNGYAIRSQGIARALNQKGFETLCFVRPGRPWEIHEASDVLQAMTVDGVRYIHSNWHTGYKPSNELDHLEASIGKFIELFKVFRPSVVIAASNWTVGMPAYIAAQRLCLPFFYEVRGFWAISRISRFPDWKDTSEFLRHVERETWVCNRAEKLFTLNRFMGEELVTRGAQRQRISLVPNSVSKFPEIKETDTITLRKSLGILVDDYVLGYTGALTEYEGLDHLVEAVSKLSDMKIHVLIVGGRSPVNNAEGFERDPLVTRLQSLAADLGIATRVTFTGRVLPERLNDYFNIMDATVLPRRALPVCELVSAIKPLEYLAYGKPVIASDVAPQAEFLEYGKIGWLYEKDNVDALAKTIKEVYDAESSQRQEKCMEAQRRIHDKFQWERTVQPVVDAVLNARRIGFRDSLEGRGLPSEYCGANGRLDVTVP
jgi:glycosyltransferase involved in cell wall biosynthesis